MADAFLIDPHGKGARAVEGARRHFSSSQIAELGLALVAFLGFSKLRIALGLEPREMPVRVVPTPGQLTPEALAYERGE